MSSPQLTTGTCLLCGKPAVLQRSHVIPAFVFRWLKDSSGNSPSRSSHEPNKRIQDGPTRDWLCYDCEQLFGRSETSFANRIFHPYFRDSKLHLGYAKWMLKFCVSVAWRTLQFFIQEGGLKEWSPDEQAAALKAEEAWRDFLLDKRKRTGEFELHVLPVDIVDNVDSSLSPNFNRYLARGIDLDLVRSKSTNFTYTKIGRFIIVGFIRGRNPQKWKGTLVDATQGVIKPRSFGVPRELLDYVDGKARLMHSSLAQLSPKQQQKVNENFKNNVSEFVKSDAFRAMNADVEMFGSEAFVQFNDDTEDPPK
jgi:hypothetical protein